jgi:two-component system nitrogen regulation response regulator GlnG
VIAATNKPLEKAVANREFREDLFYRLNVVRIHMPPLRERKTDIPLLVNYFLRKIAQKQQAQPKTISSETLQLLDQYHWPGNVRELENVIHRAVVIAKGDIILPRDLPGELHSAIRPAGTATPVASPATVQPPAGAEAAALAPAIPAPMTAPPPSASGQMPQPPSSSPKTQLESSTADLSAIAAQLFQWARQQKTLKIIPAMERELIIHALRETRGNQVQAAKLLGITRATLRKRVEKFGIRQELSVA